MAERPTNGSTRIWVAIADVDALVQKGSAIDRHAAQNTTSVYTAAKLYPMLPERLSTDLTSLVQDEDRLAVVVELVVADDGALDGADVYRATVRNHAKLAYDAVSAWLEGDAPPPDALAAVPGLEENLRWQDAAAQRLRAVRHERGALDLETIEARAVFAGEEIRDLEQPLKNRARELIEDLMIAVNGVTARFLDDHGLPSLRRVLRSPERWARIVGRGARARRARCPAEPDCAALEAFLRRRKRVDPLRFPDLSLTIVKLMGSGEYAVDVPGARAHRPLRPRGARLHALDGAEPALPRRHHAAHAQGRARRRAARLLARRARRAGAPLHRAGGRRDEDRAPGPQVGRGAAARRPQSASASTASSPARPRRAPGCASSRRPSRAGWSAAGKGLDVGDRVEVRLLGTDVERGFIDFARVAR